MKKTCQFRIYPNKNHEVILNRTLGTCRYLYNNALIERKKQAELNRLRKSFDIFPWGKPELMQFTKSKAECAGKIVEFVNPAGTSQTCICGFHVPKDLSVRVHRCPSCGLVMGRDQVSAILIENSPISTVGTTGINARQGYLSGVSMQRDATRL